MGILNRDVDNHSHINVSWNYQEFEVSYPSLSDEVKIGDYYLRVLLEEGDVGDSLICEGTSPEGGADSPKKRHSRKA